MILTSDFEWAVVRLATLQTKREAGRLLFATVTLLSPDRPLPPPMRGIDRHSIKRTGETLFFRRTILSKPDAIDWYRSLGDGNAQTPIPTRVEDRIKGDGVPISVSQLTDSPIWPAPGLPMGDNLFSQPTARDHPAPFMGNVPSRIHRRFSNREEDFGALLADDDALAFAARRLHIDLRQYPEYLGSTALIVPDPIVEKIDCFMVRAEDARGERIFYRIVPRPGQTLAGVQITTFDEQHHLLTGFETHAVPAHGILDIAKGSCTGTYGYVLTHADHGMLAYSPPTAFLRQLSVNMHLVPSGGTKVSVPMGNSPESERMAYLAAHPSQPETSVIGEAPDNANATLRIGLASSQRARQASARQYGQRWFAKGSREEAMRFIQGEISKAKSRVLIADPYLASLQLGQFLYAVQGDAVRVVLLTTRLAFKAGKDGPSKQSKLQAFADQLADLSVRQKVVPKVYVIPESLLHDRFLVIDDNVWFLGNSLNALGDKASLIVKLPDPAAVIEQLESMVGLQQAKDFDGYRKNVTRQAKCGK